MEAALAAGDPPPLAADELQHLTWLASSCPAVPLLTKPQLARLLDDRTRLILALRNLLRCPAIDDRWREPAERVLLRVDG
jgi:hypothetical protein